MKIYHAVKNEYLPSAICSAILARLAEVINALANCGEVSEWLKELAWKASIREIVSRVRISPSPPAFQTKPLIIQGFFYACCLGVEKMLWLKLFCTVKIFLSKQGQPYARDVGYFLPSD